MKKLFGRDKPKIAKVTSVSREIVPSIGQGGVLEDAAQYAQQPHQTPREAVLQQRTMGRSSTDEHWEVITPYNTGEDPSARDREQLTSPRPPALTASRSSSLASLPPGASPPIPSPHAPRSGSPFSISTQATIQSPPTQNRSGLPRDREREHLLRKKLPAPLPPRQGSPPPPHPNTAALGILRALDPFAGLDHLPEREHKSNRHDHARNSDETLGEDKREKKGFWGNARERDRERDRDRDRERGKDRRDEESQPDLTKLIGWLTASSSEDWALVLEVCDRASASEANAKEAVKALRREFKYAEPPAQLAAARLWAIMVRNSSKIFMEQIMAKKFIDTLEDVLTNPKTSPVVRERLMDVLAAVAYASGNKSKDPRADTIGFRGLWRRVKPVDKPDEGVPFDINDTMFNPPVPKAATAEYTFEQPTHNSQYPQQRPSPPLDQSDNPHVPRKRSIRSKNRIIPLDEDMRRLFQECKIGQGNANLLSESLAFARPEDLQKEIIGEFYTKCKASQELIYAQIPWASAGAERSRVAKGSPKNSRSHSITNGLREEEIPIQATQEEQLLADLLAANESLMEALRVYEDLERVAIERQAEEISRRDVRMDRRQLQYQEEYAGQLEAPQAFVGGSSSRSPSPSPTDSPTHSFQQPAYVPSVTHPLPRIPANLIPGQTLNNSSTHLSPYGGQNVGLVPPPPAPHGPRSPAHIMPSRTPSPERFASAAAFSSSEHRSRTDSSASSRDYHMLRNGLDRLQIGNGSAHHHQAHENEDDEDECTTPIKPSAKALGKRRVVEVEENDRAFDTDDMFYDREEPFQAENKQDSDSEEASAWQHSTNFVYDAAAERTKQRIQRGRVSTLVDGVH